MTEETPPAPPTGPTPEQIARAEHIAPLLAVVQSDAYMEVASGLDALRTQYMDDPVGFAHLHAVITIMPRLKAWAESQ